MKITYYIGWKDTDTHFMGPYTAEMISWLLNRREFWDIEVHVTTAKRFN